MKDINNFQLKGLDGHIYKISDFEGKKVYIKFWATWCSMCLSGLNQFIELEKHYKNNNNILILSVITPVMNAEMDEEDFIRWYNSQNYSFNVMFDTKGELTANFQMRSYPSSLFLDDKGRAYKKYIGHINNSDIKKTLDNMKLAQSQRK